MVDPEAFERAIRAHDEAVAASGQQVWLGGEPTFTARLSAAPEWLSGALGGEKEIRARALVTTLAELRPRVVMLRSLGRKYPGEDHARFCYGLLRNRDGSPLWNGPPDPMLANIDATHRAAELRDVVFKGALDVPRRNIHAIDHVRGLRDGLAERLRARGFSVGTLEVDGAQWARLVFCLEPDRNDLLKDADLTRASVHTLAAPGKTPTDELAARGSFLVSVGAERDVLGSDDAPVTVRIELPSCTTSQVFRHLLVDLGDAARALHLPTLIIAGFGPPTDAGLEWTTITPDPGVVEVNMAPCINMREFWHEQRTIYAAAERNGLHPYRLYYNGELTDSGGGGHLTFGGPSLEDSPFFVTPHLLPRLIAYFVRHPSLSYWFASASIGSSSQSPRVDEAAPESFGELSLALHTLWKQSSLTPEQIWQTLAPLLTDRFGNSHRAEINVEKLCNPYLPGRGQLGVVELRALRMPRTPERAVAIALLLRSIVAWLGNHPAPAQLMDWGAELHDRFALPFYLERDLNAVIADLAGTRFALAEPVTELLHAMGPMDLVWLDLHDARLRIRQALEFWPLVGDLSAPHEGTSRMLDSSAGRIEITLHARDAESASRYVIAVDGHRVPMRVESTPQGAALVFGVRYRRFVPSPGLHPLLPAQGTLVIDVTHPRAPGFHIELHSWRPDGSGYPGLPVDMDEAEQRRYERVIVQTVAPQPSTNDLRDPPPQALTPHSFDTRFI